MTDITPPPELVQQWMNDIYSHPCGEPRFVSSDDRALAARAAQWGSDQELEACCAWLPKLPPWSADDLRRHRRPKPPSLKEQALAAMREMQIEPCVINGVDTNAAVRAKYDIIRRALEALPND